MRSFVKILWPIVILNILSCALSLFQTEIVNIDGTKVKLQVNYGLYAYRVLVCIRLNLVVECTNQCEVVLNTGASTVIIINKIA